MGKKLIGNYLNIMVLRLEILILLVSGNKLSAYYRQFVLYGEAYFNRIGSKIVSEKQKNKLLIILHSMNLQIYIAQVLALYMKLTIPFHPQHMNKELKIVY